MVIIPAVETAEYRLMTLNVTSLFLLSKGSLDSKSQMNIESPDEIASLRSQ